MGIRAWPVVGVLKDFLFGRTSPVTRNLISPFLPSKSRLRGLASCCSIETINYALQAHPAQVKVFLKSPLGEVSMRARLAILASLALATANVAAEAAPPLSCTPDLFKDYSKGAYSDAATLAMLDIVDQSNFDTFKQNFAGNVTVPIEGVPVDFRASWDSFKDTRSRVFTEHQYSSSSSTSLQWLNIYFSATDGDSRPVRENTWEVHFVGGTPAHAGNIGCLAVPGMSLSGYWRIAHKSKPAARQLITQLRPERLVFVALCRSTHSKNALGFNSPCRRADFT
jgi:hypothetical protein